MKLMNNEDDKKQAIKPMKTSVNGAIDTLMTLYLHYV